MRHGMGGVKGVQQVSIYPCLAILDVWAGKSPKEHLKDLLIGLCGAVKHLYS